MSGFAFKNVTGARPTSLGGCNYGNNAYGAQPGDTQWFYSSLQPPSASYNIAPGGASTGTHGVYPTTQDCSLVVEHGTTSGGSTTFPSALQGTVLQRFGLRGDHLAAGVAAAAVGVRWLRRLRWR